VNGDGEDGVIHFPVHPIEFAWTKIDYSKKASEWMRPMKHGKEIDLVEIGANW
jgi:hypothetical protein